MNSVGDLTVACRGPERNAAIKPTVEQTCTAGAPIHWPPVISSTIHGVINQYINMLATCAHNMQIHTLQKLPPDTFEVKIDMSNPRRNFGTHAVN